MYCYIFVSSIQASYYSRISPSWLFSVHFKIQGTCTQFVLNECVSSYLETVYMLEEMLVPLSHPHFPLTPLLSLFPAADNTLKGAPSSQHLQSLHTFDGLPPVCGPLCLPRLPREGSQEGDSTQVGQ